MDQFFHTLPLAFSPFFPVGREAEDQILCWRYIPLRQEAVTRRFSSLGMRFPLFILEI